MQIFTPIAEEDAERVQVGGPLPGPTLWWVDVPQPDEAQEDAVWVAIDVPEAVLAEFAEQDEPALGYREFAIPSEVAGRYRATRADMP